MGFGRRLVRRSARRVARKTVHAATPRPVRKAIHPANTVKNAVTPRPVKQVSRAAYTVRHPVGAAENKALHAMFGLPRRRRRRRGFWRGFMTFSRTRGSESAQASPAAWMSPQQRVKAAEPIPLPPEPPWEPEPSEYVPPPSRPRPAARAPRARPVSEPVPGPPTSANHPGQIEYQVRRKVGLGSLPGISQPETTDGTEGMPDRTH